LSCPGAPWRIGRSRQATKTDPPYGLASAGWWRRKGLWWLPSDDAEKLPGTLTVTKGAAALELIGHFGHELLSETQTEKIYSLDLAEQPRIVGMSTGGKPITLEGH
jgi:hypothetical protein